MSFIILLEKLETNKNVMFVSKSSKFAIQISQFPVYRYVISCYNRSHKLRINSFLTVTVTYCQ